MPEVPNLHAAATLLLTGIALVLFTRERLPLETSSLAVLVMLTIGFEVFPFTSNGETLNPAQLLLGFGHEALVAVCALMVAAQGLVRTGALEPVGRLLGRLWTRAPRTAFLATLLACAVFSAFINNTPIVVLMLPILVSISLRTGLESSKVLMPMAFATLIGGTATTIGTSTNLLVVSVAADLGVPRIEMFDFVLPAAVAGGLGIVYLWLVAPRLLPARSTPMSDVSPRVFSAHLRVQEGSYADGRTLSEAIKRTDGAMRVSEIRRGESTMVPLPDALLRTADRLAVKDTPARLKQYEQELGAQLYSGDTRIDDEHPLTAKGQQLAEIVVVPGSLVDGVSLRDVRFIDRYQLVVLAVHRAGRDLVRARRDVADIVLTAADVLLVQGASANIARLKEQNDLLVLDATLDLPHTERAPLAFGIMGAAVLLAATGLLPIALAALCGALAMILTRCLSWREATDALSVQIILIVVTSLALASALTKTGATDYLSTVFLVAMAGASPAIILSGLMLFMAVITNVVSNNAAAVIGTPIAVAMARDLGLPADAFVLAVLFGANMSYATPMAYQTNLLVMSAGAYVFSDFVRIGVPLTLIMWLTLSWLLPMLFGF